MTLEELKAIGKAPEFLTSEGYTTLSNGYLLPGETPADMYRRVAKAASTNYPQLEEAFYSIIWNNFLCLSTPVAANLGTTRGLPISCFGSQPADNIKGIFDSYTETALLSKYGGGTSKFWGGIRGRGANITGNGKSEGIIGWLKTEEATLNSVSQGGVRRGAGAQYLPITHPDIEEFIDIRRQTGDASRRCLSVSFHHGVTIPDSFMQQVKSGDVKARELWTKVLKARVETGEPYLLFEDNVNNNNPKCYIDKGLRVNASNLCNEIFLTSDPKHTFVCCLSSLNLDKYDLWKGFTLEGKSVPELAIYFLDGVMSEFIAKAKLIPGLERVVRFAEKGRSLGLGVLGWHTLLQNRSLPFDSFEAMQLNAEIFRTIRTEADKATRSLAAEFGEPEWCKGYGIRNTHVMAVAPTVSNSLISGGVSQGVEPVSANFYAQKSAKGTFIRKNPALEKLLESYGKNTFDVWESINKDKGSVKNLNFLSAHEKLVFLTAREINQFAIIKQAAQRQRFIDQGQSINLFFAMPTTDDETTKKLVGKYIHECHMMAWELGLKGLYYFRSESPLKGDSVYREESDCAACES